MLWRFEPSTVAVDYLTLAKWPAGVVVLVGCCFLPTTAGTDACVAADSLAADAALGVCKLSRLATDDELVATDG